MTVLASDVKEFLQAPNVAAFASVRPDGRPHVTPVWYEYDGREFIIGSFRGAQKLGNVTHKGYAALCIYTHGLPYRSVIVQGTAPVGGPLGNRCRERGGGRYLW